MYLFRANDYRHQKEDGSKDLKNRYNLGCLDSRCGRSHLAEETRALLGLRLGLLGVRLLALVRRCRVRLVLLLGGSRWARRSSSGRPGGSAASGSRRGGGTTALTRHIDGIVCNEVLRYRRV